MCPYLTHCKFTASTEEEFETHMDWHATERPWPCEYPGCNWRFSRKPDLKKHFKMVHEDYEEVQYYDDTCCKEHQNFNCASCKKKRYRLKKGRRACKKLKVPYFSKYCRNKEELELFAM